MIDPILVGMIEDTVGEAIENIEPAYSYKGSVATTANLPSSGNSKGDLWQVQENGSEWAWDGTQWVQRRVNARIGTAFIDSLWP